MSLYKVCVKDLASLLLPWSRPSGGGINEPFIPENHHLEQSTSGNFLDHQQLTRTCHEYRDTEFWMKAFMLKWRREASESGRSLSITVRVRWVATHGTDPDRNTTLQLQPSRKFAHSPLAPPCRSFCNARPKPGPPDAMSRPCRQNRTMRTQTIEVKNSAQASEILRELARPLSSGPDGIPADKPHRLRRRRRARRRLDDPKEVDSLDSSQ